MRKAVIALIILSLILAVGCSTTEKITEGGDSTTTIREYILPDADIVVETGYVHLYDADLELVTMYTGLDAMADAVLDAASGYTVYVGEGTFDPGHKIIVNKSLKIKGAPNIAGAEEAILNGGGVHDILEVQNDAVLELENLQLYDGDSGVFVKNGGLIMAGCKVSSCDWGVDMDTAESVTIDNSEFLGNMTGVLSRGDLLLKNSLFKDNYDDYTAEGGGGLKVYSGTAYAYNNIFCENKTDDYGGAALIRGAATTYFYNNVFYNNDAADAGAVYLTQNGSSLTGANNIFWGNTAAGWGQDIAKSQTTALDLTYSCIESGEYYDVMVPGDVSLLGEPGNIDANPLFVDAANYNFNLGAGSPCEDTGTSSGALSTDKVGESRPQGADYDMGAYER
ncbi:right-handed parallel beta-helix repeat-containing protein [Candidatus Margulisiibacteriota bacterium]